MDSKSLIVYNVNIIILFLAVGGIDMYDFLLVGAGLFNAVIANEAHKQGKSCLVIDKRTHIGGNCYTEIIDDIVVHKYGAHIFRTNNKKIWEYLTDFTEFNHFINSPMGNFHGEMYNLPFNMNTFSKLWGITTPNEAKKIIKEQASEIIEIPQNLEQYAISLVGKDIYEKLIKGYTEKQWGRPCSELPASIMKRIPVRFRYDNNYYDDKYQGIPFGGYTPIIEQMFAHCDIEVNADFMMHKNRYLSEAKKIIYTAPIDEFYEFIFEPLQYRSLQFEIEMIDTDNYQGVAVVNYTDRETPYTRIIEHKHFEYGMQNHTIISKEYPVEWKIGMEPFYPVNDEKNQSKYKQYQTLAEKENKVVFGGRLGTYSYTDMQDTIQNALKLWGKLKGD